MRFVLVFLLLAVPARAADPGLQAIALEAANADRTQNGRGALRLDDKLNASALAHARDMLERGYFAHRGADGSTPRSRFLAAGGSRFVVVGENLARCSGCSEPDAARVRQLQRDWMNSPGHRENVLSADFNRFGFAVVQEGGEQYAVQTFAGAGADAGKALPAERAPTVAAREITRVRGDAVAVNEALTQALAAKAGIDVAPDLAAMHERLGRGWRRLTLLSATCGGCGTEVTAADVRAFVEQWEGGGRLSGEAWTELGFAAFADGTGRKRAFALLGQRR